MPFAYQDAQLNETVKKIPIREGGDGRPYVLAEDIRDAFFYFGDKFELRGIPVPFLENEQHERLYPERIASYPSETLRIVPVSQEANQVAVVHYQPPPCNLSPLLGSDIAKQENIHALLDSQTKTLMSVLGNMQAQVDRLEQHALFSDGKISEILVTQKNITDTQDKLLGKMDVMIANTEALLTQTFELHEYTLPRLFIVLPEVAYHGINPAHILSSYASLKFRLYFLCECGTHTSPSGPHRMNHIHIARHEGYEIKHPTEFFRKYGPYVLRLLHALKLGLKIASGVIPALATVSAMDLPEHLTDDLELKVTSCIMYLTAYQRSIDTNVPGMDNGNGAHTARTGQPTLRQDIGRTPSPLDGIVEVEGADLRRLSMFLQKKDQDRALGNLFRTVDAQGHVKWICLDHYRSTYPQRQDREFEDDIRLNHGEYDKRLGIVTVVLPSSEIIDTFMVAMTRASAFNELDVHLRNYGYQDLKTLGDSLKKTTVSKLTLTAHQYKGIASMCKKKLPAILDIMAAGKIRYFKFRDIKDLLPSRGVQVPKAMPNVRSLELTGISVKEGHGVLGEMLHAFSHLAVFHLEDTTLKLNHLKSIMSGLSACKGLQALSFRNCEIPEECSESLAAFLKTRSVLTELDLGQNFLDDVGCCEIIEAVGCQLVTLSLKDTGFGDESAMALERIVGGDLLKSLDVSNSSNELGPEASGKFIRLVGRLQCTELMLPKIQEPCDELCARMVRGIDASKLERLEIEGSDCGDQTAEALATMLSDPVHPCTAIVAFKFELPRLSLVGANALGSALPIECKVAKVSFAGSRLFPSTPVPALLTILFTSVCSRLKVLDLKDTSMSDEVASILCDALQTSDPACRLEYLDLSDNRMTPAGGAMVLNCLHKNATLEALRMESLSFGALGSMGAAARRFLETNRTLNRLTISHMNLGELTRGLSGNANVLKAIEIQYIYGTDEDVFAFGDFLASNRNTLLRLVIKRARVCDDSRSLEYLSQRLKQNYTLVDLEWDFDQGIDAESHVLQRHLDRNRDLWRKNVDAKERDLALAGVDVWTVSAICRGAD